MTERIDFDTPTKRTYALDAATRAAGRRGLANARDALAKARAHRHEASERPPLAA